jgi:hypothetical protein
MIKFISKFIKLYILLVFIIALSKRMHHVFALTRKMHPVLTSVRKMHNYCYTRKH